MPIKKAPGTAVDPRNGARHELRAVTGERPELSESERESLTVAALSAFDAVIDSPIANALTKADHVILVRWVKALSNYEEAMETALSDPMSTGSMGQDIVSPWFKVADGFMAVIEKCERQLGIGPKNRADLGITLLAAGRVPTAPQPRQSAPINDEPDPRKVVDA